MNVNGYELSEWTFSTGGEIAFAKKDGKFYFLKRYNAALRPSEDMPSDIRKIKEENFSRFTSRRDRINATLDEINDPKIVKTVETFVDECHLIEVNCFVDNVVSAFKVSVLPRKEKAEALLSAVEAVALIHSKNLVHSDIKPSNMLMVREDGKVAARLIDFDSSYFTDETASLKSVGGDDFYGAPETVANISDDDPEFRSYLSRKADIFSLGLTLYEYYTGGKFETGEEETKVWSLVCDGKVIDVGEEVDEPLRSVINKMLSYEPDDRPTAQEVYDALKDMAAESEKESAEHVKKKSEKEEKTEEAKEESKDKNAAPRGGAGKMSKPDDGYPLNAPWREDNIQFVKEYLDFYGFVRIERIFDGKGERYYRLVKHNGVNLLRKKEQLILMGCACETEEGSETVTEYAERIIEDAKEVKEEIKDAEKVAVSEYVEPEEIDYSEDCDICEPWEGHSIEFDKKALIGIGCRKVERLNPEKKMYRLKFDRIFLIRSSEQCVSEGYAVEKKLDIGVKGVTEKTENKLWDGDEGVFVAEAIEKKQIISVARCIYKGCKVYEVTFRTYAGKKHKCVLSYSDLRMLGVIA